MKKEKTTKKPKCDHEEAFAVAFVQDDQNMDDCWIVTECPDCGQMRAIIGSLVTYE
jgi:hypothetical protein